MKKNKPSAGPEPSTGNSQRVFAILGESLGEVNLNKEIPHSFGGRPHGNEIAQVIFDIAEKIEGVGEILSIQNLRFKKPCPSNVTIRVEEGDANSHMDQLAVCDATIKGENGSFRIYLIPNADSTNVAYDFNPYDEPKPKSEDAWPDGRRAYRATFSIPKNSSSLVGFLEKTISCAATKAAFHYSDYIYEFKETESPLDVVIACSDLDMNCLKGAKRLTVEAELTKAKRRGKFLYFTINYSVKNDQGYAFEGEIEKTIIPKDYLLGHAERPFSRTISDMRAKFFRLFDPLLRK